MPKKKASSTKRPDMEALSKLPYSEIEEKLRSHSTDELVQFLNAKSRKVGDTAFSILANFQDAPTTIIDALISGKLTHRDAKVRATNFLLQRGRAVSDAARAFMHVFHDKNAEVADNALFGIVFLQDQSVIPHLQERRKQLPSNSMLSASIDEAIKALRKQDPFSYSRYYHDLGNVWELDPVRFKGHVGPL